MASEPVVAVRWTDDLADVLPVRHEVFVVEQRVPLDEEVDGLDPVCRHVLLTVDGEAAGTARLREVDGAPYGWTGSIAKCERVAVRSAHRGLGLGRRVMQAFEREVRARGLPAIVLGAQVQVIGFYEGLGYEVYGPEFLDANIRHRMMRKALRAPDGGA